MSFIKRVNYKQFSEWEREIERSPDYGAPDGHIDDAETENNYHIIYPKGSYKNLGSPYVATGSDGKRKDPYMMSSFVTADSRFFELHGDEGIRQFFTDVAKFFADTYGMANVFTAIVHMDEGDPHMHVCFFPYEEGHLTELGCMKTSAIKEFQNELYDAVGKRWRLEKPNRSGGVERRTHEAYLQARLMYQYQQEVLAITQQIEDKRDELWNVTDRVEDLRRQELDLKFSVRDLHMAQDSLKAENKQIMARVLDYTDYMAGMEMAVLEDNPYRSKDRTIEVLKARNYALVQQVYFERKDHKDTVDRLKETEDKLRTAKQQKDEASLVASRLLSLDPELYKALLSGTAKPKDTSKDKEKQEEREKTA